MINKLLLFSVLIFGFFNITFSQNVGIGTTNPQNFLHISPVVPGDPIRIDGLSVHNGEQTILVVNPSTGIVRYMPLSDLFSIDTLIFKNDTSYILTRDSLLSDRYFLDSLIGLLGDSIDTDIDSMRFINDTLYLFEDNQVLSTYIATSTDTALIDSLIYAKQDSLYTYVKDSILVDSNWLVQLDSLLQLSSDTVYFNDSSYTLVRDSLLSDQYFLDSLIGLLGDSIDTDIDSVSYFNDTLYIYEDGHVVSTYINSTLDTALVDSLILAQNDSVYSFVSDSLLIDSNWLVQLDSLLRLSSDTVYFNDSSYTLVRDSLLSDQYFLDSLIGLLGDSIDTDIDSMRFINDTLYLFEDNQVLSTYIATSTDTALIDSLIYSKQDSLYTYVKDSLLVDSNWLVQLDSLLQLSSDTVYFNDSSYTLVRDSLLSDQYFLDSLIGLLGDSIDTDIDSVSYFNDTLYIYEDGHVVSTYINSTLDTALVDSLIYAKQDSLYTYVKDSLLIDSNWLSQLDSLLQLSTDTVYFNDSSYTLVRDSLLSDQYFLDSLIGLLGDSIDTDIDSVNYSNDTLYIYEDGHVVSTHINSTLDTALVDSLILAQNDSVFSFVSDSLLRDQYFLDSLTGLLGDSINTDNQNLTLGTGTATTSILNMENGTNITLIEGTNVQFTESGNNLTIDVTGDGTGTDDQNLLPPTLSGTVLTTNIENGNSTSINLQPIVDSAVANASGADNDWDLNANGTGLEGRPGTNVASGTNSIAAGGANIASGTHSIVAGGSNNSATNSRAVVSGGSNNSATGIRSVVVGGDHNMATGNESFLGGGDRDTASGENSVVVGGLQNKASGTESFVGGGERNKASGINSTISGGFRNIVGGSYSTISGGAENIISSVNNGSVSIGGGSNNQINSSSSGTTISGGVGNAVTGSFGVISGGRENIISGAQSIISGGFQNRALADESFVGGGDRDTASGDNSVVVGGLQNKASGIESFVGGGEGNKALGNNSVVSGGVNNLVRSNFSTISGGDRNIAGSVGNTISGGALNVIFPSFTSFSTLGGGSSNQINSFSISATISGGSGNAVTGNNTVISGGRSNTITGNQSSILGGIDNTVNSTQSVIVGGISNISLGYRSFVGGGDRDTASGDNSVVGGGLQNKAGGVYSFAGGGEINKASGGYSTIPGGQGNISSGTSSVVSGGRNNLADGQQSIVSGGSTNTSSNLNSTVSGGFRNIASGNASTVGGGDINQATGFRATIAGGSQNIASGTLSSIIGGAGNHATAMSSVAIGRDARAKHRGAVVIKGGSAVLGDSLLSTASYQFSSEFRGGYRMFSNSAHTTGVSLASGGGAWATISDRNKKENFKKLSYELILEKINSFEVTQWNYKSQDKKILHIGPMAQDFYKAFGLGQNNTTIVTSDISGVNMAGIKGLIIENKEQQQIINNQAKEIEDLKTKVSEIDDLKKQLKEIKQLLKK